MNETKVQLHFFTKCKKREKLVLKFFCQFVCCCIGVHFITIFANDIQIRKLAYVIAPIRYCRPDDFLGLSTICTLTSDIISTLHLSRSGMSEGVFFQSFSPIFDRKCKQDEETVKICCSHNTASYSRCA